MHPVESLIRLLAECSIQLGMGDHSFIVGGAPRDCVLQQPVKDLDVVVEARGDRDAALLASLVAKRLGASTTPDAYGVCHVGPVPGRLMHLGADLVGQKVEIVAARSEKYDRTRRADSHKPVSVAPGTIVEDLQRRDFTINTLMWRLGDLVRGPGHAPIVDLLGTGIPDLEARLVRTPLDPAETFDDDPSRMLRAVRFAVKYGFTIDPATYDAIVRKAGELRRLPADVVGNVFVDKILTMEPDKIVWAVSLMEQLELLFPTKSMVPASRVRRRIVSDVEDASVIIRLARLGFDVGVKFRPGQLDRLEEVATGLTPGEFQGFFSRFRKPLDAHSFMEETGIEGAEVGVALEKARDLVLSGLDENGVRMALLRDYPA